MSESLFQQNSARIGEGQNGFDVEKEGDREETWRLQGLNPQVPTEYCVLPQSLHCLTNVSHLPDLPSRAVHPVSHTRNTHRGLEGLEPPSHLGRWTAVLRTQGILAIIFLSDYICRRLQTNLHNDTSLSRDQMIFSPALPFSFSFYSMSISSKEPFFFFCLATNSMEFDRCDAVNLQALTD